MLRIGRRCSRVWYSQCREVCSTNSTHDDDVSRPWMASTTLSTLVKLRSDVILENTSSRGQTLIRMDESLRKLIADRLRGTCRLERLQWDTSDPVDDLEVLVRGEQVHPMESLEMLKMRFGRNKRVFVLKHDDMYGGMRPLLATYVSLCRKIPASMVEIEEDVCIDDEPTVAAFYSINNMERGLKGIELGQGMIHGVVDLLKDEFPASLNTFVTLSPIPGFRSWIQENIEKDTVLDVFNDGDVGVLVEERVDGCVSGTRTTRELLRASLLALDNVDCDPVVYDVLGKPLQDLCKIYLEEQKDPVFRFHVDNGARLYRINHHADMSRQGRRQSYGLMANYLY